MKRWFIARMGFYLAEDPDVRAPAVAKYTNNFRIWNSSQRLPNWCFGQCAAANFATIRADPDIYVLPDGALDMSVGSIPANVRTTMRNRLEAAGFTFTDVKTTWTVRQLLVYLLKQIQPPLDTVEQGDVQDIEQ